MSKHRVKQFERLSSQASDIDELVASFKRALYKVGFRRPVRAPKNRWEMAHWLFLHFHDSFLRLQKKSGKKRTAKSAGTSDRLTVREREVLRWSATGMTRREIARTIGLSHHTVDFHMRVILRKLDATNMLVAVTKAQHLGLIAFEPPRTDARLKARRERAEQYRQAQIKLIVERRRAARKMSRRRART